MSRILFALTLVPIAAGCRPAAYVQPEEAAPHAILKVRHVVHQKGGREYGSTIRIGEYSVDERTLDPGQEESATVHLRVRPEVASFAIRGASFHRELRTVQRTRSVREPYTCYQQKCSYAPKGTKCEQVTATCYRSREEHYSATELVTVTDDACGRETSFRPAVGGVYLLQFDYLGQNECTLGCLRQEPRRDGEFDMVPCTDAP